MTQEPRTIHPVLWGSRPIPGRQHLDFRPQVVPAEAEMPKSLNNLDDKEGGADDPKAPVSSAIGNASSSETGSGESGTQTTPALTMVTTGPTSPSEGPANPAPAEKDALSTQTRPALGLVPLVTGEPEQPVEPTS